MKQQATDDPAAPRTRSMSSKIIRALEVALWIVAALGLGAAIGGYTDLLYYQYTARPSTESPVEVRTVERDPSITPGTPIARLEIPRIGLDVIVAEGSTPTVLRRAVGRLEESAWPGGEPGNVVLAGHRDTFFRELAAIREGDLIVLDSNAGRLTYEVEWVKVVDPTDIHVLSRCRYPALTLITCYPFQYVGRAPQRFVVRARGQSS